ESLSKRAPSTTRPSLRLESITCERSRIVYRKTLLHTYPIWDVACCQCVTESFAVVVRSNCVRPLDVVRSLTAVCISRKPVSAVQHLACDVRDGHAVVSSQGE